MPEYTMVVSARPSPRHLSWQVGMATLARLVLNTSRRFAYPFAPALSRGLGMPLTSITSLIAVNQIAGLSSLFIGPLSDRWGYRTMMLAGLGVMAGGMLLGGFIPLYGVILLALLLAGLGKTIYDPALQAYVGQYVSYGRRGMVIGIIEFSWAGASLIGIPLIGLLIDRQGWQAPFFVLGGLGLISMAGLGMLLPKDKRQPQTSRASAVIWASWRQLWNKQAALGAVVFSFLANMASDNLFVVYGVWLERDFTLSVVAVGGVTIVIGLAELSGEVLTATVSDRLGLKRTIIIAITLSAGSYLLLPWISQTLSMALVGLFLIFLLFEFMIVTSLSLFTELLPEARATMMSAYLASASLGRVSGALISAPFWLAGGLTAVCTVSAVISGLALISLLVGLRGWRI